MTSRRQFDQQPTPSNAAKLGFESGIGSTMVIDGQVTSAGPLRIDGRVMGPVRCTDRVSVTASAKVVGDICAPIVEVAGTVEGNIMGQTVALLKGAVVNGNITSPGLKMDEGALVSGSLIMNTPFVMPDIESDSRPAAPASQAKH